MKLYVARHTQTNYNMEQLCNGDPSIDVHLTEKGIEQAKQLAQSLTEACFEVIYISQLPRTRETADYINQFHTVPMVVDSRLNDNVTGFEGKPIQEYLKAFNNSTDKWREAFNDGESLEDARQRAESFLTDIRSQGHNCALVVTHGYITEAINGIVNELSYDDSAQFLLEQGTYKVYEI